MRTVYLDSSVLVALLFEETLPKRYDRWLDFKGSYYSSYLLEAEIYASAAREGFSLEKAGEFIERVSLIIPEGSLKKEYLRIFGMGYCRGADACHLATALYLDPTAENLVFLTADEKQANMARKIGFQIA